MLYTLLSHNSLSYFRKQKASANGGQGATSAAGATVPPSGTNVETNASASQNVSRNLP